MKATINGIALEGTPKEIAEYQRLTEAKATVVPTVPGWGVYTPNTINSGVITVTTPDWMKDMVYWNLPVSDLTTASGYAWLGTVTGGGTRER